MFFFDFPKKIAIFLIKVYQKTLSFDHGPLKFLYPYGYCQFHPSCSEYSKQAIDRFGLIKGGVLAVWRVLRCNPWAKGGVDEVSAVKHSRVRGPDDELDTGNALDDKNFLKILNLYKKRLIFPYKKSVQQFVVCPFGLVGSGKTTFIKPLAERLGLVRVSTDEIRTLLKEKDFNFLRTKEITFLIIKELIKNGFGVAVDADCAGTGVVEKIQGLTKSAGVKLFLIHINTPEDFILKNIKKFRTNHGSFLEAYHRRKPLHKKLDFPFVYTFDLSRGDIGGQVDECEKKILEELKK